MCISLCQQRQEEVIKPPEAGVTKSCTLSDMVLKFELTSSGRATTAPNC